MLHQFGDDLFPGNQVHHGKVRNLHPRFAQHVGERRHAIDHDEGRSHQGGLDRGRAAGDDARARMMEGGQRFRDEMNIAIADQFFEERGLERARDRQEEFVVLSEFGGGFEDGGQVHPNLLAAAAGHEGDPGLRVVERLLRGIVHARNFRGGQIGQRMSDERCVYTVNAIEILFKREDHQRLVDVFAEKFDASLAPRPELRADVVHNRNAAFAHLASHSPVEGGSVDDDGEGWALLIGGADELSK